LILLIGVGGTTYRHRHDHIGVARSARPLSPRAAAPPDLQAAAPASA
jgi:hypothetical protein